MTSTSCLPVGSCIQPKEDMKEYVHLYCNKWGLDALPPYKKLHRRCDTWACRNADHYSLVGEGRKRYQGIGRKILPEIDVYSVTRFEDRPSHGVMPLFDDERNETNDTQSS